MTHTHTNLSSQVIKWDLIQTTDHILDDQCDVGNLNLPTYLISPGNELSSKSYISKTEKNLKVRLSYLVDSSSFQSQIVSTIPNVNIIVKQVKNRCHLMCKPFKIRWIFYKTFKEFSSRQISLVASSYHSSTVYEAIFLILIFFKFFSASLFQQLAFYIFFIGFFFHF